MKIANQLIILVLSIILAACGSMTDDTSVEAKRAQLSDYKQQVQALQEQIAQLESELDSSTAVEYVNVKLTEVQPQLFEHFIEVTGDVEAEEEVNVSPESSGKIIEILAKEGDRVQKGSILAQLNTDIIDKTIDQVMINLELATTTYERQKNLWEQNIGSEMQYLQAKSNKESLEQQLESLQAQKELSVIKAPVDGVVDVIYQKQGEIASPATAFAKVININHIKVYGDVAETYLTKVHKNDKVNVEFPAISKQMEVPISQVGNFIDPNNRTFRIRVDLSNIDNEIKPNMISIVRIRDYVADSALVIPSLLIKEDFQGKYVFIAEGSGNEQTAKKVYVETGVSDNNITEVVGGLEPGMEVISEGFNQVVNGSAIRI